MPTFDPTMIPGGEILRVSVDSGGVQGNNDSYFPAISADGRYVVFNSYASNLVSADTNGASDIFVRDLQTNLTTRVSVDSNGIQGNGHSYRPVVSADGRYVAFDSDASNLVPGDTNGNTDVFVHDRQTGVTRRVSVRSDGWQGLGTSLSPSISADGRYIAFDSSAANLAANDTNLANDIFLHDRQTGATRRISTAFGGTQADHDSRYPSISADGRYIAFESEATNLIPGDTNGVLDVFRYDSLMGQILRVSVDSYERQANGHSRYPSISADGSLIAFESGGTNLVSGDTNAHTDVFLHDTSTGTTIRVSVDSNGLQANNFSEAPSISEGGRYIAFESAARNLVPADDNPYIDAFVHERGLGKTTWVSASSIGGEGDGHSNQVVVSADGQFLAFTSWAANLVPYDTNLRSDVFVYRQTLLPTATATVSPSQTPLPTATPVIDKDRDTTGVFRPSNGLLYLKNSNDTGIADLALNYGLPGDYPVVGDWDGNGTVTIGVYRNGYFYLKNSNTLGFAEVVFPFGQLGDQPIAGDWNGDGVDTIGVYRTSTGQFLLRNLNSDGLAAKSFYLGNVGDVGIAGDWDGDGLDTTGVFRPGNGVIFLKNKNEDGFADIALNYGLPGDQPVTGDWDDDGIDTIGVYRNGLFLLRNENTIGFAEIIFGLGNPGDMPIAGNWDALP
jgi:Tol biopolymer transport system component